jgi:hypothetical protein
MKCFRCSLDFVFLLSLIGHVSVTFFSKLLNKTFNLLVDWLFKVCLSAVAECSGTVDVPDSSLNAPELSLSVEIMHRKTPRSNVALNMPLSLYSSSRLWLYVSMLYVRHTPRLEDYLCSKRFKFKCCLFMYIYHSKK